MNCVLVGDTSEIGSGLGEKLKADGWNVVGWNRATKPGLQERIEPWDLIVCTIGTLKPIGHWSERNPFDGPWINAVIPIQVVTTLWGKRKPGCRVCFLAGSNPNKTTPGYSSYDIGKMALLKAVENMDAETSDATIFALAPGFVPTKFHEPTKEAGIIDIRLHGKAEPESFIPRIYACLKWCLEQPKSVIGGRNIHVNDPWDDEKTCLPEILRNDPDLYKLRRMEP